MQPLSSEYINWYLDDVNYDVKDPSNSLIGLKQLLQRDKELEEFARTPLIFSVMTVAYQGYSLEALLQEMSVKEKRYEKLFDTYIERMFQHRRLYIPEKYSKRQVYRWLNWLGDYLTMTSQTVFSINQLKPIYFSFRNALIDDPEQRKLYIESRSNPFIYDPLEYIESDIFDELITRIITPHLVEMRKKIIIFSIFILIKTGLYWSALILTEDNVFTPFSIYIYFLLFKIVDFMSVYRIVNTILFLIPTALIILLIVILFGGDILFWLLGIVGIILGGLFSLIILGSSDDIEMNTTLKWSWEQAKESSSIKNKLKNREFLLFLPFLVVCFFYFFSSQISWIEVLIILGVGTCFTFLTGFIGTPLFSFLLGGFRENAGIKESSIFNQTRWKYLKNILILGIFFGIFFSAIAILFSWLLISFHDDQHDQLLQLLLGAILNFKGFALLSVFFGLISASYCGGISFFRYFTFRLIIYCRKKTPWNYARFLDYAADRLFLQKVGGGYIFIHRMLMEHFANMKLEKISR